MKSLPKDHVLHSQIVARLCGQHVTGRLSAGLSHWDASVLAEAKTTKRGAVESSIHINLVFSGL